MMFELKHSRVSVIFYQVHVILKFSKTAALFSERPLKNEIVLWQDFLSYFLLHKKLASNLTHDIFVLLCKIIFLTHFYAFTHFFKKIILHINIFGRMTTNLEDYLANWRRSLLFPFASFFVYEVVSSCVLKDHYQWVIFLNMYHPHQFLKTNLN